MSSFSGWGGSTVREFEITPEKKIALREITSTEGDLGYRTWGSAMSLSKKIVDQEIQVKGKKVLELGSGTGLCGLVAAACDAASVLLTDYHENLIDLCRESIRLNRLDAIASSDRLDWARLEEHEGGRFQTIIGSDIVYELFHATQVPKVVRHFLMEDGEFVVAIPTRNKMSGDVTVFEEHMKTNGFHKRVLRVHIGRSNGGVVKPSLLFECLAFALSVRVRRKPTTFFALEKKIRRNKERRNTNGTHTPRESDRLASSDLEDGLPRI
ncbi:hypothetical protein PROFUN_04758 [Planoprotostelium fungivorum]|uniref:Uncharacterized protein n=1 Tax=Planoprotostelium fungivorum TaxID=1890364 RepID=A0A2P6NG34_9EUKA|nr:hypothetical protein PROFUN_04758 [Planoprotostelium fungivorum]